MGQGEGIDRARGQRSDHRHQADHDDPERGGEREEACQHETGAQALAVRWWGRGEARRVPRRRIFSCLNRRIGHRRVPRLCRFGVLPLLREYHLDVKVVPGERRITVTGAVGRRQSEWSFVYTFHAGHRYALSASSALSQDGLKLTDQTTNTSTVLD